MKFGDWTCEKCGEELKPYGYACRCEREAAQREIQEGKRKRASDLKVGDTFKYPFYPSITIETIQITDKGRVVINGGDLLLWDVQWVDMLPMQPLQAA